MVGIQPHAPEVYTARNGGKDRETERKEGGKCRERERKEEKFFLNKGRRALEASFPAAPLSLPTLLLLSPPKDPPASSFPDGLGVFWETFQVF